MKIKTIIMVFVIMLSSCNRKIEFKETEPLPFNELGFKSDFKEYLSLKTFEDRKDGEYDPLGNKKIKLKENIEVSSKYKTLFTERKYKIFERSNYKEYLNLYPDIVFKEDYYSVQMFYENEKVAHTSVRPFPAYVDAIESNNIYSYILNTSYYSNPANALIQERCYSLFYAIYSAKDFPYTVYFDKECIYLMNQSKKFCNEYLNKFNKDPNIHLFKK